MIERKERLNKARDIVLRPFTHLHKIHTNLAEAAKNDGTSPREVIFVEGIFLGAVLLGPTLVAAGILTKNPSFVVFGSIATLIATLAVPTSIIATIINSPEDAKAFIQVARGSSSTVK